MKQFGKTPKKEGDCFGYVQNIPTLIIDKQRAGIFDAPQIRELTQDPHFEDSMNNTEVDALFRLVVRNFFGTLKQMITVNLSVKWTSKCINFTSSWIVSKKTWEP